MSIVKKIDQAVKNLIFSIFWWAIDPLDKDRIFGQLKDTIDRHLDINNPDKTMAPDHFEVLVNNGIFIKHAHSIKNLETILSDMIQRYVADNDYELLQPRVKLQIASSATLSKRKADIRCWFSTEEQQIEPTRSGTAYKLSVVEGEGKGMHWDLNPGNTYKIGRLSSSDICLPFDNISKTQATLYYLSENKISIVDEGSANGTFIDTEQNEIKGSRELKSGSKIRLCKIDPIILTLTQA